MSKLKNIFLVGPTGAGKTTIGRLLAKELNLAFHDSDQVIIKRAGADIPWIFDVEGEKGFRLREEQVITELTALSDIILATGGGAILSASNRAAMAAKGNVIYLQVSLEQQLARVEHSQDRPLLKTANLKETLIKMRAHREPLYTQLADLIVPTDKLSVRAIVEIIITKLDTTAPLKNN